MREVKKQMCGKNVEKILKVSNQGPPYLYTQVLYRSGTAVSYSPYLISTL